jgi:hypothetical protein
MAEFLWISGTMHGYRDIQSQPKQGREQQRSIIEWIGKTLLVLFFEEK